MIVRRFTAGGMTSEALFSDCGAYRFRLTRQWGEGRPVLFVMLNPSTADERRNDPTVARCEARARAAGFPGFAVVNLFAFRAARPADLWRAAEPRGEGNDEVIRHAAGEAAQIVCAWGNHGLRGGRGHAIAAMLRARGHALSHLGLTGRGAPRHPLYVAGHVRPLVWQAA